VAVAHVIEKKTFPALLFLCHLEPSDFPSYFLFVGLAHKPDSLGKLASELGKQMNYSNKTKN